MLNLTDIEQQTAKKLTALKIAVNEIDENAINQVLQMISKSFVYKSQKTADARLKLFLAPLNKI